MEIRTAAPNDAQTMGEIHAASWKTAYRGMVPQAYLDALEPSHWSAILRRSLSEGTLRGQLVWENDRPVGCSTYGAARGPERAGWGEIVSIYLLPEYMGRGLGTALIHSVLADLHRMGYQSVYLWALQENLPAHHFYERCGFTKSGDVSCCELEGEKLAEIRFEIQLV